jgi:hypothetical protein
MSWKTIVGSLNLLQMFSDVQFIEVRVILKLTILHSLRQLRSKYNSPRHIENADVRFDELEHLFVRLLVLTSRVERHLMALTRVFG